MAEEGMAVWLIIIITILALIGFAVVLFLVREYMQGGKYKKDTRIDGKIVIITGANTGIGKETAIDLAKRGGKIYMACRDVTRGETAVKEVIDISKSMDVYFLQLDLASMESIRQFSNKFHEMESQLHILINNAGVMICPKLQTKDGFEMQIGTNHMGHFLLTNLLLDLLKISTPSRVVVVSSIAHIPGYINKNDLNSEKSYNRVVAYNQSKLANILFSNELARKMQGTGVTVNSLHPGAVMTDLQRHVKTLAFLSSPIQHIFFKTAINGAQTQIRLAVDPDLENVTGKYFKDCKQSNPTMRAQDEEMASWLWKTSEEWVGLSTPMTIA